MEKEKKVLFDRISSIIIGVIIFVSTFLCCCVVIDATPVADDIYRPLFEQVQVIEDTGKKAALEMDNAIIDNVAKTITIENSECKLILTFDEKEIIQIQKVDNAMIGTDLLSTFGIIFCISFFIGCAFSTIITIVGNLIYEFCIWLYRKIKEKIKLKKFKDKDNAEKD